MRRLNAAATLRCVLVLCTFAASLPARAAESVPEDFPRFSIPGQDSLTNSVRELFWLHYAPAGPLIPLWDEWMPMATLWPARGGQGSPERESMRRRWAEALAGRAINAEGYVHTHQHDGPAHAEGWPFPFWMHAGGVGWHFVPIGVGGGYEAPVTAPDGWQLVNAVRGDVGERGWVIKLEAPGATAQTPAFSIAAKTSPWLRLNWFPEGLGRANCYVEWTTAEHPKFSQQRRMHFSAHKDGATVGRNGETRTMIPVYRSPGWSGTITGLRISFDNSGPGEVVVKSLHTASDTRHNVNNLNFIRGCHDYFLWTRDVPFLRSQMVRVRRAMRFVEREFQTRQRNCIYTTWPGHEGRSGVRWVDGVKTIVAGEGIGSNYWDLLPFGGEDALATVYYYDALLDLANLEEAVAQHADWSVSSDGAYEAADLRRHAADVQKHAGARFWNETTGRFGTRDLDGELHDYGFTFLNNEAIYFDFATPEQAASIRSWLSGGRIVDGDTSTGPDIYHWRFGPRSTTRRNTDYYVWNWSSPESVPWGYQVQDGGAVLGWSYYDLMATLRIEGADAAALRLQDISGWFDQTQAEGGYRAYYGKDPSRGTMQGGHVAGGLGLDNEFFESVLLPQVMLYGFLGFEPRLDGFAINPRLPAAWHELTVTRIHLHDQVLEITARQSGEIIIQSDRVDNEPLVVYCRSGASVSSPDGMRITTVELAE